MADGAITKTKSQSCKQSRDKKAYDFGYRAGYDAGWEMDLTSHITTTEILATQMS